MNPPSGYERKFTDFIQLCSEAKAKGTTEIIVGYPWALGDNYEELIESLTAGRCGVVLAHRRTQRLAEPQLAPKTPCL
jgi:hypothetical protein